MKIKASNRRGNVLFIILIAIFLVGLLAKMLVEKNLDTVTYAENSATRVAQTDLQTYADLLRFAVQNMMAEGVLPANLDDVKPGAAGYTTAPHNAKLYHPYGGGVQYYEDYAGWNNIEIHMLAAITGIGPSTGAEILAVGDVSEAFCTELAGGTPNTATDVAIDALQAGTAITLDDGTTCTAGCDNVAAQCLRNATDNEYVYYVLLYPR